MTALIFLITPVYMAVGGSPILLDVDASTAPKDVIRVHETVSVTPGPKSFVYCKWIPGSHGPSGPITQLIDLHFRSGAKELAWRRDDVDMFTFHVVVPSGESRLEIDLANVAPTGTGTSPKIGWINFNQLLLYPSQTKSDDVIFHPRLKLPDGWQFATALHGRSSSGGWNDFDPVPLTRLIDSPILSGAYIKKQVLDTGAGPGHEIDMAGDDAKSIQMPDSWVRLFSNLPREARALFGATHYNEYHWLVPVSDTILGRGLEHHESSEDGAARAVFTAPRGLEGLAGLLAHEYTHSWCGKYRRPAGLATPNYQEPMRGELLYVYEGMTQYWGTVLPARAGLWSKEEFLNDLAGTAATMDHQSGRIWRNVQDTAIGSQISRNVRDGWSAEHRGQDYYLEGVLIWLEADAKIRELSHGAKSLDNFCQAFFGPPSTGPMIRPYAFDELVSTLVSVQKYDWRNFLRARLDSHGPGAPLKGLEASGWKLVYTEIPTGRTADFRFSLGLTVLPDGTISEIISRMPGDDADVVPGQKITEVNGQSFSLRLLEDALRAHKPFDLGVKVGDDFVVRHLGYTDGPKYPHLERIDSKPDLLSQIIASKAGK